MSDECSQILTECPIRFEIVYGYQKCAGCCCRMTWTRWSDGVKRTEYHIRKSNHLEKASFRSRPPMTRKIDNVRGLRDFIQNDTRHNCYLQKVWPFRCQSAKPSLKKELSPFYPPPSPIEESKATSFYPCFHRYSWIGVFKKNLSFLLEQVLAKLPSSWFSGTLLLRNREPN